jgi:hypothetical protein
LGRLAPRVPRRPRTSAASGTYAATCPKTSPDQRGEWDVCRHVSQDVPVQHESWVVWPHVSQDVPVMGCRWDGQPVSGNAEHGLPECGLVGGDPAGVQAGVARDAQVDQPGERGVGGRHHLDVIGMLGHLVDARVQ